MCGIEVYFYLFAAEKPSSPPLSHLKSFIQLLSNVRLNNITKIYIVIVKSFVFRGRFYGERGKVQKQNSAMKALLF